jgi:mercuric ion transport protein
MKTRFGLLVIPAVAASMLPALGCPLCWPGYAALLSSFGLGFLASAHYLFPLTIALLGLALMGLAIQARRQGLAPLMLASAASLAIVLGKFAFDFNVATYAGVALLLVSSALSVIRGREVSSVCAECASNPGGRTCQSKASPKGWRSVLVGTPRSCVSTRRRSIRLSPHYIITGNGWLTLIAVSAASRFY